MNTDKNLEEYLDNFVFNMKGRDFVVFMKKAFPILGKQDTGSIVAELTSGPSWEGRILYGVDDICQFLKISRKTFYNWKEWMLPALKQNGKKVMADADYLLVLYDENKRKGNLLKSEEEA